MPYKPSKKPTLSTSSTEKAGYKKRAPMKTGAQAGMKKRGYSSKRKM